MPRRILAFRAELIFIDFDIAAILACCLIVSTSAQDEFECYIDFFCFRALAMSRDGAFTKVELLLPF